MSLYASNEAYYITNLNLLSYADRTAAKNHRRERLGLLVGRATEGRVVPIANPLTTRGLPAKACNIRGAGLGLRIEYRGYWWTKPQRTAREKDRGGAGCTNCHPYSDESVRRGGLKRGGLQS
ncbi:hypothetical protein Rs2_17355 [Raphanus sativus]|nr:hypothetical protein Rs2_17355 [Raphanus sativus]